MDTSVLYDFGLVILPWQTEPDGSSLLDARPCQQPARCQALPAASRRREILAEAIQGLGRHAQAQRRRNVRGGITRDGTLLTFLNENRCLSNPLTC
ncbi:hypothetical protein RRG08_031821 [Elysia crispata]|uniref:Uncharacterized protein n=1 Tax=Elysia crispata TaxID=231223 RepID=A0AAE0Y6R6_9GAST|nr:hypothetical protein RRG08_031821 [Elysia crispata]